MSTVFYQFDDWLKDVEDKPIRKPVREVLELNIRAKPHARTAEQLGAALEAKKAFIKKHFPKSHFYD